MKGQVFNKWVCFLLTILTIFHHSHGSKEVVQPISHSHLLKPFIIQLSQWKRHQIQSQQGQLQINIHTILAGLFCFVAASISSAGGLGGGGIFLPILNIVAGLDLRTSTTFTAFMVTGGSVANVICHLLCHKTPMLGCSKPLIDYDIALLSEPCMLLGVSVGVICNTVFPDWFITMLFVVFLAYSTFKTWRCGVTYWRSESVQVKGDGFCKMGNRVLRDDGLDGGDGGNGMNEPLLGGGRERCLEIPWKKLGLLVMVWVCFFALHAVRGDRDGQGEIKIKPCGAGYWIISSLQIPLAIAFTAFFLYQKDGSQYQTPNQQTVDLMDPTVDELSLEILSNQENTNLRSVKANSLNLTEKGQEMDGYNIPATVAAPARIELQSKLIFPLMALLSGMLGGLFGIGGGMLINPILLQMGIPPQITAATSSFMVLFSSSMSSVQYLMLGMKHVDHVLIFAFGCFIASLLGLAIVQRVIVKYRRASLIVFSVGTVMAVSTVLITSFGVFDVWREYESGQYMGFRLPC